MIGSPHLLFDLPAEIKRATAAYVPPRCDLCEETEYLFGLCYKHYREKGEYISRNHEEEGQT